MSKYPSNWTQAQIGDVFSVKRGDSSLTKSSYCKSGTLAYSGTGPDGFVQECQNRGKGIIISSVGAQCGKVFKASGSWTAINNTIAVTEKESRYDIDYLYFILERQEVLHREGGAQPFISQKEVMGALINFPPLPEQKKIAEILSGIDRLIKTHSAKKSKMSGLLVAMRARIFTNASGKEVSLGELCSPKQWPTISADQITETGYPVYGANGQIGFYSEYNHQDPVLAVTCRGATCGNLNLIPGFSYVTGNSMCLDNLSEDISIQYLYHFLVWRELNDVISGSAQPQITRTPLQAVQIVVPAKQRQSEVVSMLAAIATLHDHEKEMIARLENLKNAVSIDLLSGRKRVTIQP